MDKFKFCGSYHLDWRSKRDQSANKVDLKKRAEITFKVAKDSLSAKADLYKKNKFYFNLHSMPEYAYYLGCKAILKMENEKRKKIKNFIKNMNKKED